MRTFLDSGVLLHAWRGKTGERALAIMESTDRTFVSSQLVRLELLPKAEFHKQKVELGFYHEYFLKVVEEEPLSEKLAREALALGAKYGLAAADALNLAAAIRLRAEEFITTERSEKPMFRLREIKVTSLA